MTYVSPPPRGNLHILRGPGELEITYIMYV